VNKSIAIGSKLVYNDIDRTDRKRSSREGASAVLALFGRFHPREKKVLEMEMEELQWIKKCLIPTSAVHLART
jgi:hypothetical protein